MLIVNPIYDVAFKYLMEDTEIAKGLIGKIIGEEIESLELHPQELTSQSEELAILILRLDFRAIIKKKNGEHQMILIELQKAKMYDDLLRFRTYLGENYKRKITIKNKNGFEEQLTLPITTIYFLGFPLPNINTSILKVNREYLDLVNGKKLKVTTEFVEKLTHNSFIILITQLPKKERTELEGILQVFNQIYRLDTDYKLMEINEANFSKNPLLSDIIKRLKQATNDKQVLNKMLIEDEVESTIEHHIREKQVLKSQLDEKNEVIKGKDEALIQQQKLIEELKAQLKNKK